MKKVYFMATALTVVLASVATAAFVRTNNASNTWSVTNVQSLTQGEITWPEWPEESQYQYCVCKKSNKVKKCLGGNAGSLRPTCHKAEIGESIDCQDYNSNCS